MKRFQNILVGVDLSDGDRMVCDELSPPTAEAVERALWLAKLNSARLRFFYSLDVGSQAERIIRENAGTERTVLDKAEQVLDQLVAQASRIDVAADSMVTFGKSWLELIRQVLLEQHDLVIVGSKHRGTVERLLIGSTGMKLLRKCPSAVWITHPPKVGSRGAVLVAHDLTEVGDLTLELGASMAEIHQAPLHVVHAIETLQIAVAEPLAAVPVVDDNERQEAIDRIQDQLKPYQLASPAEVHVANGSPRHDRSGTDRTIRHRPAGDGHNRPWRHQGPVVWQHGGAFVAASQLLGAGRQAGQFSITDHGRVTTRRRTSASRTRMFCYFVGFVLRRPATPTSNML